CGSALLTRPHQRRVRRRRGQARRAREHRALTTESTESTCTTTNAPRYSSTRVGPPRLPATSLKRSASRPPPIPAPSARAATAGRARNDLADHADAAVSATPPAWSNDVPEVASVVTALSHQLVRDGHVRADTQ